jgi:ATP-dependent RNA helicase RhlE
VHRIGRTGRAGFEGSALSLVCADEAKHLFAIEKLLKRDIPRVADTGYEPVALKPIATSVPAKRHHYPAVKKQSVSGNHPNQRQRNNHSPSRSRKP